MIRHIVSIKDFQAFQGWSNPGARSLKRVNVIYGQNGSGKSTLSSLLSIAASGTDTSHGLILDVEKDGHPDDTRRVTDATDAFWRRVRVFNREFVKSSLRFDHDGGSEAEALLVLGKDAIGAADRLEEIDGLVAAINTSMPGWKKGRADANAAAGAVLTGIASRIVEDLSQLEGRYRARSYTKAQVTPIADGDRKVLDKRSTELLEDLANVKASNMPKQALVALRHPDLVQAGTSLTALTKRTAAGTAIEELRAIPVLAEWAQTGLHLHENRTTCAFCGNALTPVRLEALREHFDASSKTLRAEVKKLVKALEMAAIDAKNEKDGFPRGDQLFAVFAKPYKEAIAAFDVAVSAYVGSIAQLKVLATAKGGRLFDSYEDEISKLAAAPSAANVVAVVDRHNKQVDEFDKSRGEAAQRVEMYRIFDHLGDYDKQKSESKRLDGLIQAAESELKSHAQEVAELIQPFGDPGPLATQLTADVARLLGRSDLTFASRDGKYVIERNGAPALGLSEGEQTAISLLYFLSSLNNKDSGENLVVVVDDPVSSLDANVLVGASSHLWSEVVKKDPTRQLILFTHNFELFRIWSNQLDGPNFRGKPTSSIHELRMVTRAVGELSPA